MKVEHHGLSVDLPDDWWLEAGMTNFTPKTRAYRVKPDDAQNSTFYEVRIQDIEPLDAARHSISIFRDDIDNCIPARERVMKIFRGFQNGDTIDAVRVLPTAPGSPHKYRLVDGTHRLYCSLAAGFTDIPTVKGFDWNDI